MSGPWEKYQKKGAEERSSAPWETYVKPPETRGPNSTLSTAPGTTPEQASRIPEGMVYDPQTGGYVDTALIAERGGAVPGAAANFVRGGLGFGSYFDEAAGAIDSALTGANPEIMAETVRQSQEQFADDHGKTAAALQFGGALTSAMPAARVLGGAARGGPMAWRVAKGMGLGAGGGAVEGAIYGYGAGDDQSREASAVRGAMVQGLLGGALGGALPLAGSGVSRVAEALSNRPSRAAAKSAGMSPASTEAVMRALSADDAMTGAGRARIASAGPSAMVADAGGSVQDLLDTAIQRSGPGARIARDAVDHRAGQAGQAVRTAIDDLAPPAPVFQPGTPTGQLYERAYSTPIDYSSNAGRQIESLIGRVPGRVIAKANELIRMDPDAINPQQILADIGDDGSVAFREMPNVLQLDYITRALKDTARNADGMGAMGGQTNEGRIYGNLARSLRKAMRDTVPQYGEAVDQAATQIGARQATELGADILRMNRRDLADEISGMGAAELGHLRVGVKEAFNDSLDRVRRTLTQPDVDAREAAQAVKQFSSKEMQDKLRMVFGDAAANRFLREVDEIARAVELQAGVATNSRTFVRTATDQGVKDTLHGGPVETLARGEALGAGRGVVQALTGRTPANNMAREQEVYEEIARLLTQPRGSDAVRAMQLIEAINQSRPISRATANRIGSATSGAAALPIYQQGRQ